jgi:cell division transport system permease protein
VTANLELLGDQWSRSAEMSVYLTDDISPADRQAVEEALRGNRSVAAIEYVSKSEALNRFKGTFGELAATLDGLGSNPLPASYEVRVRDQARAAVDSLTDTLRAIPGVTDIRYDRRWLDRLLAAVGVVRGVGLLLGTVLTLAAALTVANVVRLALYARRDELEIMQLVGAPQTYIRGPFVMEGVLQGGIGALVALAVLAAGFFLLRGRVLAPLASAVNLSSIQFLPAEVCLFLVIGGMAVGCVGGLVAASHRG